MKTDKPAHKFQFKDFAPYSTRYAQRNALEGSVKSNQYLARELALKCYNFGLTGIAMGGAIAGLVALLN